MVVAINLDKNPKQAERFLQRIPAQFTVAFDHQGASARQFHVQGMPSSYLVDRQGNVRARHIGFREEDKIKLEQAVASLLKE
jgi:peroxiredoxin